MSSEYERVFGNASYKISALQSDLPRDIVEASDYLRFCISADSVQDKDT